MFESTLQFISQWTKIIDSETPSQEEREFVYLCEINLAKSLLTDLDTESARKVGEILIAMTRQSKYTD